MNKKVAIITSISGNKDILYDPEIKYEEADYFAFVDQYYDCRVWNQKRLYDFSIDKNFSVYKTYKNRRNAKIYKILPEFFIPNYEYYIWLDGTHELKQSPNTLIETYLKNNDISVFKHIERNCVYQEAKTIEKLGFDTVDNLNRQIDFYKSENFPENYGLFELSCFLRKNIFTIRTMDLLWWEMICRYSSRDQMSFPFVIWKLGIIPSILPGYANGVGSLGYEGNNTIAPKIRKHCV